MYPMYCCSISSLESESTDTPVKIKMIPSESLKNPEVFSLSITPQPEKICIKVLSGAMAISRFSQFKQSLLTACPQ